MLPPLTEINQFMVVNALQTPLDQIRISHHF